jgi:phosphohistidine phosphatase
MTRRLILMRHAKSSWDTAAPDHDRPLNDRGRRAATALGSWLREQAILPDQILCSSAARTVETCARLRLDTAPEYHRALYHADPDTMLRLLRGASGHCVLMIGHNPGIAAMAAGMVSAPPDSPHFDRYPTGATLVADFGIEDWGELIPGTGQASAFIAPRELG